ncbi:MAG: hypothetical protein ACK2US_17950 [Anaerolineae bacterium]|jgi:hypothetical protein
MSDDRQSHAFVLRIWWEEGNGSPVWRGWVQHAASGDTCYVHRLADLIAFLEMRTGLLDMTPGSGRGEGGVADTPYIEELGGSDE